MQTKFSKILENLEYTKSFRKFPEIKKNLNFFENNFEKLQFFRSLLLIPMHEKVWTGKLQPHIEWELTDTSVQTSKKI